MHITIIAFEYAPFIEKSRLSRELVQLTSTLKRLGHTVSVLMPFSGTIDVARHSLARRLMPVKVPVSSGQLSCHRYDGRTPFGIEVFFLDIENAVEKPGGIADEPLFFEAVCHVLSTFSTPPDGCVATGAETAGFVAVLNQNETVGHLPVVSALSTLDCHIEESVVRALESADRIVLSRGRLYAATLSESLSPLKEMLSKGHIQWIATPTEAPRSPIDKVSSKTAFQMERNLPVRDDIPLVLFLDGESESLSQFLMRDIQAAAVDTITGSAALLERYRDRLVVDTEDEIRKMLPAADACIAGARRDLMAASLINGAVPIVTAALGDEAVDLETSLSSGSAIVIPSLDADSLTLGLERLVSAFHLGQDFKALLSRLPGFACTWEKTANQLIELIKEIALEKKRDGQTD